MSPVGMEPDKDRMFTGDRQDFFFGQRVTQILFARKKQKGCKIKQLDFTCGLFLK
jgi:hypothetical protein